MRRLCDQMRKMTTPELRREYLGLNRQFHFIAFRRAGSERPLRFLAYVWDVGGPYTYTDLMNAGKTHQDHGRMMDLFEARDVEGIIEMMRRHHGIAVEAIARWQAGERS